MNYFFISISYSWIDLLFVQYDYVVSLFHVHGDTVV